MSPAVVASRRSVPREAIPAGVLEVCDALRAAGHRAWIVGGCVRDALLGRAPTDWDIATSARPDAVARTFRRVVPTGAAHGTVTVLWKGSSYEVTTLRGEGAYSDGRRPDEVFFVDDIVEDLARRDFTVNAIALEPETGALIDPFDGLGDMDRRAIRAVGVARERFDEDGLRVLRAARFVATLEFDLEPATERAISDSLPTFRKVSPERVRDEWMKSMKATRPSRAFRVMARTGILGIVSPDLASCVGCEQNRFHAFDVWEHTLHTLDACAADPVLRIAALLHDVGKPRTRDRSPKTGDFTFFHHERVGAGMADAWLRRYRFSNDERDRVVHLVAHHLVCYSDEWTDAAVRRFVKRVGAERVAPLLALARADVIAKGKDASKELADLATLQARVEAERAAGHAFGPRDLAIGGKDVMSHLGIPPGPIVGKVLEALLERVLDDPGLNTRERLVASLPDAVAEATRSR